MKFEEFIHEFADKFEWSKQIDAAIVVVCSGYVH